MAPRGGRRPEWGATQADGGLHNRACFLAEQSAQFAVKDLPHGVGQAAWGHDLVALGEAMDAALERSPPDNLRSALQRLSRHYIPARAPTPTRPGRVS